MEVNKLVEGYIKLRDAKAKRKAAYEADVAKIDKVMEGVEAKLLQYFQETGIESVRTDAGTAYKSTRTSATVADRDAFFFFVQQHDAFQMLEARCAKNAVAEYKEAHGDLPPGLNWSEEVVVGFRRS